jgi:anti-sigma-K factor RskA
MITVLVTGEPPISGIGRLVPRRHGPHRDDNRVRPNLRRGNVPAVSIDPAEGSTANQPGA